MDATMRNTVMFTLVFISFLFSVGATPVGPDAINITENTTNPDATSGTMVNISGGYISSLNVSTIVQNTRWKAFAGWVSGSFSLEDSSGGKVYDWTISSLSGEVYAARNSSTLDWGSIRCANTSEINAEDTALDHNGVDNISSTFSGSNNMTFLIAGTTIGNGTCSSINTYVSNVSQNTTFEEIVLSDTANIIFATNIENAALGYDDGNYDFQMIVPGNANESSNVVIPYYLYTEIN